MRLPALIVAGLVLLSHPAPFAAQDATQGAAQDEDIGSSQLIQTDVTTPAGGKGVMIRPFGSGRHPAILHLHGSGETVAKSLVLLRLFARSGYVAMDIEYSQTGDSNIDIQDAIASLEFLRKSPYVQPRLLGVNGFSRGARAALRVAAVQDVRAVSAIAARTSAGTPPTILDEADKLKMPILLQHGLDDPTVPYQDSVLLEKKLKSLKRKVQLVSYKGSGHNDLPWDLVYETVLQFFGDYLH
jgi:dipeptidyl aminopeptidase/acylaminoacyl peptidase